MNIFIELQESAKAAIEAVLQKQHTGMNGLAAKDA